MKPIWYFVGLVLIAMGAIITVTGIVTFGSQRTVLANLHADLWWGVVMIAGGAILYFFNRKPVE